MLIDWVEKPRKACLNSNSSVFLSCEYGVGRLLKLRSYDLPDKVDQRISLWPAPKPKSRRRSEFL